MSTLDELQDDLEGHFKGPPASGLSPGSNPEHKAEVLDEEQKDYVLNGGSAGEATETQADPDGTGRDVGALVVIDILKDGGELLRDADCAAVAEDINARVEMGAERYGERLRSGNGRDPVQDAYQEALDLALYLRQAVEEGEVAERDFYMALDHALRLHSLLDTDPT